MSGKLCSYEQLQLLWINTVWYSKAWCNTPFHLSGYCYFKMMLGKIASASLFSCLSDLCLHSQLKQDSCQTIASLIASLVSRSRPISDCFFWNYSKEFPLHEQKASGCDVTELKSDMIEIKHMDSWKRLSSRTEKSAKHLLNCQSIVRELHLNSTVLNTSYNVVA